MTPSQEQGGTKEQRLWEAPVSRDECDAMYDPAGRFNSSAGMNARIQAVIQSAAFSGVIRAKPAPKLG